MKHWQKVLRRASLIDQELVAKALALLKQHIHPPDTIKLKGEERHRSRVGNWRTFFHYESKRFVLDDIQRRDGHNY